MSGGWVTDENHRARLDRAACSSTRSRRSICRCSRAFTPPGADERRRGASSRWSALPGRVARRRRAAHEERQLGANLARLLDGLGVAEARARGSRSRRRHLRARCSRSRRARWQIPLAAALHGFAFAWLEAQTSAAVRLVPLGQSAGQRILLELGARVPAAVARALALADDDLGAAAPAHAVASAHHETQYSRLFRS